MQRGCDGGGDPVREQLGGIECIDAPYIQLIWGHGANTTVYSGGGIPNMDGGYKVKRCSVYSTNTGPWS